MDILDLMEDIGSPGSNNLEVAYVSVSSLIRSDDIPCSRLK